jgi:hypothetical protein
VPHIQRALREHTLAREIVSWSNFGAHWDFQGSGRVAGPEPNSAQDP